MSDRDIIIAVLWALYLAECFCWVGRETVVLRRIFLAFTWTHASGLGTESGGVVILSPLVRGMAFESQPWALAASAEAFCRSLSAAPNADTPDDPLIQFADVETIDVDGRWVRINGRRFIRTGSEKSAHAHVKLLEEWTAAPPGKRGEKIAAALHAATNVAQVQAEFKSLKRNWLELRFWSAGLAVTLLILVPLVLRVPSFWHWWPSVAIVGLTCLSLTVYAFWFAHRALMPDEAGARRRHALLMSLAPFAAARCADKLSRAAFILIHPLTLGIALMRKEDLAPFARKTLAELQHPTPERAETQHSTSAKIRAEHRARLLADLQTALTGNGWNLAELMAPPPPDDRSVLAYCPRCFSQYTRPDGACSACPGIAIIPLPLSTLEKSSPATPPAVGE